MSDSEATPGDRQTAAPFLIALTIFVLVVIAIWLLNLFDDRGEPADQQVARAAVGQNDALQRQNYSDFRGYTCAAHAHDETEVLTAQRDSVAQRGERFVDDVTDVAIDGDRATAKVTYHFDKSPDDKKIVDMTFIRDGDAWKVCSPGPR
ncbi:lumazine-binding protein [Mycobacterium sp. 852002-51961_SCH5331710]|uniref:Rv0361 family membrane protein n=1 Tax=Mycobacterium sp. 852002-51961_SCH5331710 TaxID=1834105 RepID=UPI000A6E1C92|nr:lumazine-binding protein [Mycobacterium sp. 852002-51961_SCH5331710]